ncbi:ROK family protein [Sphingorhabdus buctiana]
MPSYGLIEAGGTKFVLGIANEDRIITASHRIATTTPEETIGASIDWFRSQNVEMSAIGIGSFGPLQLDRSASDWGHVTRTPKPHWSNTDLVGPFQRAFGCPVAIETDVNAAALAEAQWGAGAGHKSLLYLTIGTGIGGGFVSNGHLLHGLSHPEMGHIRMPRHPDDLDFAGACPFHGDCLEGLASGPAIIARWGQSLSELGPDHPGIGIIAWYLAQAMVTFQAVMEPERIVLGGGVTGTPGLLDKVRKIASDAAANYFAGKAEDVICAPGLGDKSGLLGALAVALSSTS